MRRAAVLLTFVCCLGVAIPAAAQAGLRRCGQAPRTWNGYYVDVDPVTTTCGLGRSAARSYARGWHRYGHTPRVIHGHSRKTRRTYRFQRVRQGFHHGFRNFATYIGHAGRARLKVRFTYPFD